MSAYSSRTFTAAENLRGGMFMSASMFGFAVSDIIMKSFSGELGLGQVLLLRGIIASSLIVALIWHQGYLNRMADALTPLVALRTAGEVTATVCFLTALFHMPIAQASAIMQALPLAITLGAMLFLKEKVGWRRLSAIIIGFMGVLIVIRPGLSGWNAYGIYAFLAVIACVVRDISTRRLPDNIHSLIVAAITSLAVMVVGGVISITQPWQAVSYSHIFLLALSSAFLLLGYFFAIAAMRIGDIGFVSPFRYLILLFTTIGGMIAYSEFPDIYTIVGSAIVVGMGIYTFYRERALANR